MAKTKSDIQETSVKTKPKKTKKVIETENVADVKVDSEDNVKVDVEIDCRSCSNSSNQCVYIRHKRSI